MSRTLHYIGREAERNKEISYIL